MDQTGASIPPGPTEEEMDQTTWVDEMDTVYPDLMPVAREALLLMAQKLAGHPISENALLDPNDAG